MFSNAWMQAAQKRDQMRKESQISSNDRTAQNWYISGYSYGLINDAWRPERYPTPEHEQMWLMGWQDGKGDANDPR